MRRLSIADEVLLNNISLQSSREHTVHFFLHTFKQRLLVYDRTYYSVSVGDIESASVTRNDSFFFSVMRCVVCVQVWSHRTSFASPQEKRLVDIYTFVYFVYFLFLLRSQMFYFIFALVIISCESNRIKIEKKGEKNQPAIFIEAYPHTHNVCL